MNAEHAAYESKTVAVKWNGREYTIAQLRSLFDTNRGTEHWKDSIDVVLDVRNVDVVGFCQAVEFFQGDRPNVTNAGTATTVRVTSRGYVC